MNIDFMRWVDRHIGVPICFGLSLINTIVKPLKKTPKKVPDRILFIQISEMGSAVIVSPSVQHLKKKYPNAEIYYLIFEEMAEIIRVIGLIKEENLFTIRGKSFFLMLIDVLSVVRKLRKKRIDVIIDIELFSRISAILSYLIGAREIIGFNRFHMEGLYRGNFHTKKLIYNHNKHIGQNYLSCAYSIEHESSEIPLLKEKIEAKKILAPLVISDADSRKKMIRKLKSLNPGFKGKQLIILNPNASAMMPLRKWPLENYIKLAKRIAEETSYYIAITGTKQEAEDAKRIIDSVGNERIINLIGKTSVKELIDLYNVSDVIVTNDSGPGHFSALTNIKSIVLFGPETPACYGPIGRNSTAMYSDIMCSPCVSAYNHRKSSCNDNKCMKFISVDDIYGEIMKYSSRGR